MIGIFIGIYLENKNKKREGLSFDNFINNLGNSLRPMIGAFFGGLAGITIALYTNSDYDLDIGENDWRIK